MRMYVIPTSNHVVLLVPDVAQSNVTLCIYISLFSLPFSKMPKLQCLELQSSAEATKVEVANTSA